MGLRRYLWIDTDVGAPRYDCDPGKARTLLREAGYADGFDLVLHARCARASPCLRKHRPGYVERFNGPRGAHGARRIERRSPATAVDIQHALSLPGRGVSQQRIGHWLQSDVGMRLAHHPGLAADSRSHR